MIVLAEYQDRGPDALALARDSLPKVSRDRRAAYLVSECEGRQALYRGDVEAARIALDVALTALGEDAAGGFEVLQTLNAAARAAAGASPASAVAYARRALNVVAALEIASQLETARVSGELAIACEWAGEPQEAYLALSDGAKALLAASRASDAWRRTAAVFAHTTAYLTRVVTSGRRPPLPPGGAGFTRPVQGVFYAASEDAQTILHPQAVASLCVMLAEISGELGADEMALHWGMQALEEADADPTGEAPQFVALALPHMVRGALGGELSVLADSIVTGVKAARKSTSQADEFVLALAIVPLAGEIVRLSLSGDAAVVACHQGAELCADVASRVGGGPIWDGAATVLRTAASTQGDVNDLIRLANSFVGSSAEGLHLVAALLAAVDGRRSVRAIAQAHAALLRVLEGPSLAHIRQRLLANMEEYWRAMLDTAPFRFSHPRALQEELAGVRERGTVEGAARVVRAVASDLGVRR
jgi:hypothetical protein